MNSQRSRPKRLLYISYYLDLPGACQAEWADDRVRALRSIGADVAVLTSIVASPGPRDVLRRACSFSTQDARFELDNLARHAVPTRLDRMGCLVGRVLGWLPDWVLRRVTGGIGESRWGWTLPALVAALSWRRTYAADAILSTGGPASAHVVAVILGMLLRKPVHIELQDPLSGPGIGRPGSARLLERLERFLLRHADKVFYVTRTAAETARNKFNATNVDFIYPGAPSVHLPARQADPTRKRLVHLGSLYGTRTFRGLIEGMMLLREEDRAKLHVMNVGHVEPHVREQVRVADLGIELLPHRTRPEALALAAQADCLLLIQNSDGRSESTIPFKTYDYLQLGIPVLALTNGNLELDELLHSHGHLPCPLGNPAAVRDALARILHGVPAPSRPLHMTPLDAAKTMLLALDEAEVPR